MLLSPGLQLLLMERGFACRGRGQRVVGADLRRNLGSLGKPRFWRGIILDSRTSHAFFTHPSFLTAPRPTHPLSP